MQQKTVLLGMQLFSSLSKSEVSDLIGLLEYYNQFAESQRILAMENGSRPAANPALEEEVIRYAKHKSLGAQASYLNNSQPVCRCCGK